MVSICLHQIFESQADLRPSELALISKDVQLTYAELDHRANQLGRYLLELGVKPRDLVGIYLARRAESITAVLACMKIGAGYLRMDPEETESWAVLNESRAVLLLTETALAESAQFSSKTDVVVIEEHSERISWCDPSRLSDSGESIQQNAPDPIVEEMWSAFSKGAALVAGFETPVPEILEPKTESLILLYSMFAIPLAFLFALFLLFRINR